MCVRVCVLCRHLLSAQKNKAEVLLPPQEDQT